MVETLGVLAIIGLLAVGGIIGYQYAMDKYLSNELWNNVKWISVQVMTDGSLRGMGTGEELTVKTFSGDKDLILKRETAIGYSVRTGNLRESTCRQIRRDKPDWVEEVVSNEGAGCQVGEENEVKIYFNGQLNSETTDEDRYKRCERDEDCGDCGKCSEEKICVDYDALCQDPRPYCINGSCEPCPEGETLNSSGKCQACPSDDNSTFWVTNDEAGAAACHKCGLWFKQGNVCMSCNRAGFWYPGSKEECFRCPNRLWDYNVRCYHCDDASALESIPRADCNRCPNRYMPGDSESGTCYDCDEITNHVRTTVAQCHTCENRFVFRGDCRHCSDPGSFFISTEECLRCKGKRYTTATVSWQSGECRLCPEKDSAEWQALSPTFQEQCND